MLAGDSMLGDRDWQEHEALVSWAPWRFGLVQ